MPKRIEVRRPMPQHDPKILRNPLEEEVLERLKRGEGKVTVESWVIGISRSRIDEIARAYAVEIAKARGGKIRGEKGHSQETVSGIVMALDAKDKGSSTTTNVEIAKRFAVSRGDIAEMHTIMRSVKENPRLSAEKIAERLSTKANKVSSVRVKQVRVALGI